MSRLHLAAAVVCLLAVTAGCIGGAPSAEQLAREETYNWNHDATATFNVTGGEYHAVLDIEGRDTVEVYQSDDIGGEYPVSVAAVQFRYPNGSVVTSDRIEVRQSGQRTVVDPPASNGTLAYTASTPPKDFGTPVLVEGSHEVILPNSMRIGPMFFGRSSPDGYRSWIEDDRLHLRWDETPGEGISLHYYLERDFYIFVGLVTALAGIAVAGVIRFRLQIRELAARRRDVGFDLGDEE